MTADITIVIVSYNTRADLEACLTSLAAAPPARVARTVVADNASTDGTQARLREAWPAVSLIAMDANAGFAAANNAALRDVETRLALVLNSDTIVPAGAIDRLAQRLDDTGAVAAGPRLVDAQGHPEISFGPMLTPLAEWRQRRLVRRAASDAPADRAATRELVSREQTVDWVSGACLLLGTAEARAVGFFDERFFMYEEDVDLCASLRARGGRILFTPAAEITHLRGRSVRAAGALASPHYDRSHLAFYDKHAPRWAPWLRLSLKLRGRPIR